MKKTLLFFIVFFLGSIFIYMNLAFIVGDWYADYWPQEFRVFLCFLNAIWVFVYFSKADSNK
ncbi:hypothetical protein SAMN05216167_106170 [Spirosoma endophyticum]|uniref:Uncharacterized protein n=1 Tax=Spirosoma endophyticum TaxID=662367 RepID=A0A1I1U8S6_9BACT|nr:hypothetical protein SAMN05216167_106170 [Spirosoma endophyticum]